MPDHRTEIAQMVGIDSRGSTRNLLPLSGDGLQAVMATGLDEAAIRDLDDVVHA